MLKLPEEERVRFDLSVHPRGDPRRCTLPAKGEGGDVRLVGFDPARVLRRDRV